MPSPILPLSPLGPLPRGLAIKTRHTAFLSIPAMPPDQVTFGSQRKPGKPKRGPALSNVPFLTSALSTLGRPRVALPDNLTLPSESLANVFWRYRPHCTSTEQAMALANRLNTKRFCVSTPDHESLYDLDMLDTHPVVLEQKGRIILDTLDNAEALMAQIDGQDSKTNAGIERIDRLEAFLLERLATTGHMPYMKAYDKRSQTVTLVTIQPRMQAFDQGRREYTFNAHHEVMNIRTTAKKPFRTYDEPVMKAIDPTPTPDTPPKRLKVTVRDPDSYAITSDQTVEGLDAVAHDIAQKLTHITVRETVRQALDRLGDNRTDVQAFTADVKLVMGVINESLNIQPNVEIVPPPPSSAVSSATQRKRLGISLAPAYFDDQHNSIGFAPIALWEVFEQREDLHRGNPVLAKYDRSEYVLKAMIEEAQHAWQQRLVQAFINRDYTALTDLGITRYGDRMITRLGDYTGNLACYNQAGKFQMIGLDIDHWYKKQPIERDAKTVVDLVIANVADQILPPKA